MSLEAIKYNEEHLEIIDQLKLPLETSYIEISNVEDAWRAIRQMKVRGAPAIAILGCLSVAVELKKKKFTEKNDLYEFVSEKLKYIVTARPTAVNIQLAADELLKTSELLNNSSSISVEQYKERLITDIEKILTDDYECNTKIGEHGSQEILKHCICQKGVKILTHCNTGSLATSGYGTALGIVRKLHSIGKLDRVFYTETRPYNQGARLTAFEIVHEHMPGTLICDNMVAALMKSQTITAVIVGADRVAANGDTANKIGTYQIAVLANYHSIPFYVAAPVSTIDFSLVNGDSIVIEERPEEEMTVINGQKITPPGIKCWNPAFDITPARLITGIITDTGSYKPEEIIQIKNL